MTNEPSYDVKTSHQLPQLNSLSVTGPIFAQPEALNARESLVRVQRLRGAKSTTQSEQNAAWLQLKRQLRLGRPLLRPLLELHVSAILPKVFKTPKVPPKFTQDTYQESRTYADNTNTSLERRTLPSVLEYDAGVPIASLDASPDRSHIVLAGREIFKILQTDQRSCEVQQDLLSTLKTQNVGCDSKSDNIHAGQKYTLAIKDVKWAGGSFDKKIATAAANGQIIVYDLGKPDHEWVRLRQHNRQVHKLASNPFDGALLLSGSQDATVRLWDLRDCEGHEQRMTVESRSRYPGNSDAVRDLKWSPSRAFEFAIGTDAGMIQRWDIRKSNAPVLRVRAHEKTCNSVDWHPNGEYLLSAGADKDMKVWNFRESDRRMKPTILIRCPQAVVDARWRPFLPRAPHRDLIGVEDSQIATIYDKNDPRILVWDLRRPSVPCRVFDHHDGPSTSILWATVNILWSIGNHGRFTQLDVASLSRRTQQKDPAVVAAFAPDGTTSLAANHARPDGYAHQEFDRFSSSMATMSIEGVTTDVAMVKHLLNKLRPISVLPGDSDSSQIHSTFQQTLSHNGSVAANVNNSQLAGSFNLLAHATWDNLRKRALQNCSHRMGLTGSDAQPKDILFQPQDFLPSDSEPLHFPINASKQIDEEIEFYFNRLQNSLFPVYLFLNVCPWFQPHLHDFLSHADKVHRIVEFHHSLTRLGLLHESCKLRDQCYNLFPEVLAQLGIQDARQVIANCAACCRLNNIGQRSGLCTSCRAAVEICCVCNRNKGKISRCCAKCSHAGHLSCLRQWFESENDDEEEEVETACPVPGCLCNCWVSAQEGERTEWEWEKNLKAEAKKKEMDSWERLEKLTRSNEK